MRVCEFKAAAVLCNAWIVLSVCKADQDHALEITEPCVTVTRVLNDQRCCLRLKDVNLRRNKLGLN